jgi:hypothetical protein
MDGILFARPMRLEGVPDSDVNHDMCLAERISAWLNFLQGIT